MKNTHLIFIIMSIAIMLTPTYIYAADAMAISATIEIRKIENEIQNAYTKRNIQSPNEINALKEPAAKPVIKEPPKINKKEPANINKNKRIPTKKAM